jgi:integrase
MRAQHRRNGKGPGRKSGGRNKGYWHYKGRGWFTTDSGKRVPLRGEDGTHLIDPLLPEEEVKKAYARWLLCNKEQAKRQAMGDSATVMRVVNDYLDHAKVSNRPSTYEKRGLFLFDFCFGLSSRFWDYGRGRKVPKPKPAEYIHPGYGEKQVGKIIPMDIQRWLDKHPGWGQSTRRMAIQAVRRAFNYAKAMGVIAKNPILGMHVGAGKKRITYFPTEVEEAMYHHAKRPLATAIKVCIRTGARFGSEFCRLTAKHVDDSDPKCMIWRFAAEEAKTNKPRTIYVPKEIADIVRPLMKRHPTGPLFRNTAGKPWKKDSLRGAFLRLKRKLKEKGIKLDKADCMYTCRHTFAKRMLGGYWTKKPCTIEQVAGLMGNSRQVCWDHYAQWCEQYTDPLKDAID